MNLDAPAVFRVGTVCDAVPPLLAFPPLRSCRGMQLADNLFGTSFFLPSGLVVSGAPANISVVAVRFCGSTFSGSWDIPRFTF